MIDDEDEVAEARSVRHKPKRWRRMTLVVKVVRKIKMRFAIIERPTEADRMAVRRYAYDILTKHMKDIHDADVVRVAPLAAEYYWAKTESEIEAAKLANSGAVKFSNFQYARARYPNPLALMMHWLRPAHH